MIWRWLFAALLLVALVMVATYLRSPPALLNLLDRAWPTPAERVVRNVLYLPGERHGLDVWAVPDGKEDKPVLVFWHGGGWVKGAKEDYGFVGRAFAERGFVVVVADYRLVPQVRFPAFLEDGAAAVRWTQDNIAQYGGDPGRIAFSGHSAGAHTAVMLVTDPRYLTAAGVDRTVLIGAVGLSGPYDFYPFTGRAVAAMAGADYRLTQPILLATTETPPLMLVTGTNDVTVRPKNARNLARRLRELGAPVELVEYDGLNHEDIVVALSRPFRSKADVLDRAAAFLIAQSEARATTTR